MAKVKQLDQQIREELEEQALLIHDRKTMIVNALAYVKQANNPAHDFNKSETLILQGIIKQLTAIRDTDRQSIDIISEKLESWESRNDL